MDGRNMLKQMSTQVEVFKYESTKKKKARDSITQYLYYPIHTTVAVAIMRIGSSSIKVKPYDCLEKKYFDI